METLKQEKERFLSVEQRGIKNSNDIIEINARTRSNTHRIDTLEGDVKELREQTSSIGELNAILKIQTDINVSQTRQTEKLNEMLQATTNNLTELNVITKQLKDNQEDTKKHMEKLEEKFTKESEEGKISSNQIVKIIVLGLVTGVPSLILAWVALKAGLK